MDLNILVGRTQDNWKLCDYSAGPGGAGDVKIQKVYDTDFLTLCEVEVMGRAGAQGIIMLCPNLKALGSSIFPCIIHIFILLTPVLLHYILIAL